MIKTNKTTGQIWIHGPIGAGWFEEGITALGVSEALDALEGARAKIHINSVGGVADEGIAIYNELIRYPGGVDTYNDALAASAASLVFLAGKNRTMSKGSRVMIHKALTFAAGNATNLRKIAETLDSYDASIVEIVSAYMPRGTDVMALLEDETWYTSDQAKEAGLATATDGKSSAKPENASFFKHPPEDFLAACTPEIVVPRLNWKTVAASAKYRHGVKLLDNGQLRA